MATIEVNIDINKAMSVCIRNGVKIYPVPVGRQFVIEVEQGSGEKRRYDKKVSSKEVAAAVRKTYIAYCKSILKQRTNAD